MKNRNHALPQHHPDEGMLLDYATGVIRRPFCAWVATHLTFCPACRAEVTRLESVGGAVIERSSPVALTPTCLDAVLARLDQVEKPCITPDCCGGRIDRDAACLPVPLRRFFGVEGGVLIWRERPSGMGHMINATPCARGIFARLVRLPNGVPLHRENRQGLEMLIVLDGAIHADDTRYRVGDVAVMDRLLAHAAQSDAQLGCLYCVVNEEAMA